MEYYSQFTKLNIQLIKTKNKLTFEEYYYHFKNIFQYMDNKRVDKYYKEYMNLYFNRKLKIIV